jgi:hypothetical protein
MLRSVEQRAIIANALGTLFRNRVPLQIIGRKVRNREGPSRRPSDFDRIIAAHCICKHRACLLLRLIEGQQRTVLLDGQAPRRARVPVAILDDVAANPTGFHPDPKAGEGVLLHDHVLIGGLDPLDNRLAQLFGDHLFSPGTLSCWGKR